MSFASTNRFSDFSSGGGEPRVFGPVDTSSPIPRRAFAQALQRRRHQQLRHQTVVSNNNLLSLPSTILASPPPLIIPRRHLMDETTGASAPAREKLKVDAFQRVLFWDISGTFRRKLKREAP